MADNAQRDLDEAVPALEEAQKVPSVRKQLTTNNLNVFVVLKKS